jgi:hypothetical protein
MIPGLEIHQLIDDHVLQDKLVDVFHQKQPLKQKTRQYDYKSRESHKDKK